MLQKMIPKKIHVPSTQSLNVEQEDDEDQNGVYFAINMSLHQN